MGGLSRAETTSWRLERVKRLCSGGISGFRVDIVACTGRMVQAGKKPGVLLIRMSVSGLQGPGSIILHFVLGKRMIRTSESQEIEYD